MGPSDELETHVRGAPPLVVLDLRGQVTTAAQESLAETYRQAAAQGASNVLLNFAGVDYLNSGGIAAIIGIISEARRANQRVLLTGLTAHYQMVFETMGLTAFAPMFDSEEAALQAIQAT